MAGFAQNEIQTLIQDVASKVFADVAPQLESLVESLASKLIAEVTSIIESKLA